ncbi:hypothetical protein C8F04DRAFT_1029881 [Mycena alexandri]|uniref:Uncharacterized protein n=1 Tax=Mycena alexandri TaxID=1745969 RepID=A0AAD6TAM3_9AGAR|nr:hypothetical protein C8F04DRAFT_1029881 [Mycena alexandri]
MLSSLDHIPHDVLHHIALLGAPPGYALPVDLCSLLATCRAIYEGLNIHASPHLYADIFKLKYDATAACSQTDSSLASELVQRCLALRRCRHLDLSLPGLRQDLWTLLWMIVEGGSRVPLCEAPLSTFIIEVAQHYLREDVRPHGELKSLVIWLFCLGVSRDDISSQNPEVRSTLVALLRPFVSTSVPPFTSPPPPSAVAFDPLDHADEALMRYNLQISSPHLPPPASAAIILIFALKEAMVLQIPYHIPATRAIAVAQNRIGPTTEDYTAFQHAITPLFLDVRAPAARRSSATTLNSMPDPWISELLVPGHPTARVGSAHSVGSLSGVWEGSMMISSVSLRNDPETFTPSDFLCRTPMQCELSEYFCFPPCTPLTLDGHTPLGEGLIPRDLPSNFELSPETFAYERFIPKENLDRERSRPILDHVLTGHTLQEHEDAWGVGGFNFTGRVYDDGLIVLTRRPRNGASEDSEKWIFEGRLRYGRALVGTFRSSSDGLCGVHGIFSMSKRTATA